MQRHVSLGVIGARIATAVVVLTLAPAGLSTADAQSFPASGRTITTIVPVAAGGGTDVFARAAVAVMAKDLGVPVQVVNKPGGSMQVGTNEVAMARPDGYTLLWIVLPTAAAYLDPDRQSAYTRKNLQPIGSAFEVTPAVAVLASSPYRTLADLIEAAKASPGKLKGGTAGLLSTGHLASIGFQRSAGIRLATVNFQGGGPQLTALLGGHIDVAFNTIGEVLPQARNGAVRILGVMSDADHPSGVKTLRAQGLSTEALSVNVGLVGPAGMPKEVVDRLSASLRKALDDPGVRTMMTEQASTISYLDPEQYARHWDGIDARFKPLIDLAKQDGK